MKVSKVRLGLSTASRLRLSWEFRKAKENGQRLAVGCLIANWLPSQDLQHSRVGVVSSKQIGSAVIRNRARRLLREAFRLHQHEFKRPVSLVLVARRSIVNCSFQDVERDFLRALRNARLLG